MRIVPVTTRAHGSVRKINISIVSTFNAALSVNNEAYHYSEVTASISIICPNLAPDVSIEEVFQEEHDAAQKHSA